ncbi:hypothetical protein SAMN05216267_1001167 [Actinacidiphila rubida]|uniref:Uncharacterized protein n=1 Tax=Actinacidiphila rubida TaxID=310780 RepID=A0A1H8DMZ6_9ACTN|nr:hypothetical protein [Actinacidiphila rubida]SEN07887.1 hypothetical protein SAMN05216267_1001167 [Actinacidiphila rubida]
MSRHRRRPRDWHPLAASDPVPGDPDAILDEVAHMRQVALMLRGEARDLRVIGQGDGLKGRYADALRHGADGLEVHLRETAERYERVHGHLTSWAHALEDLQTEADRILRNARTVAEVNGLDENGHGHESGGGNEHGSGGDDPLQGHRASLAKVVAQHEERAAHYAALIRHEIDDKIKDSPWEWFKDAVDDWSGAISLAVDAMSYAATVIALVAIATTPAGWVAGLAIWLSVGVLSGHLLLAAAGDGSWADIAMDVFGLLTMRIGTVALNRLRGVREATKLAAQLAAEEEAAANSARATRTLRDRASAVVNRRGATRAERSRARHARNIARAANQRVGREAAESEAAVPMAQASRWEAASVGGDVEEANHFKDVKRLRAAYPRSPEVQRASNGAERAHRMFKGAWIAASASDGTDKLLGSSDVIPQKPAFGPYGDLKNRCSKEVGSAW